MIDWIGSFLARAETLIQVLGIVGGLFFIVYMAIKTRGQFVPIITTMLTVAVFIWGLFNIRWFTDRLGEDAANTNGGDVGTGDYVGTVVRPDWLVNLTDGRVLILRGSPSRDG